MSDLKKPLATRREFLQTTSVLTTSAALAPASAATVDLAVIDTHQHLWDLTKFRLPWLENAKSLDRSFLMSDYLKATTGLNIVKSVYMEVDVDVAQQLAEAQYVLGIIDAHEGPMVGAVVSGRPSDPGFAAYLDNFLRKPAIKGLRQVLHSPLTPRGYCLDPKFVAGIRLLGERNLSFDLCLRADELDDGAKLIATCPDTSFILDHCGNANVQSPDRTKWKQGLGAIAKLKNVSAKVSGIVASAKPHAWSATDLAPIINHVLEEFGPNRVVFGGDWPVCTLVASYREWFDALRLIVNDRPLTDQKKLFHDNAIRVYKLS